MISIHSPRMGRDCLLLGFFGFLKISIHSPRMGRDALAMWCVLHHGEFQSTLPAWGETLLGHLARHGVQFQSTLPAWGETLDSRALKDERLFQSTLPAWGETAVDLYDAAHGHGISIHSPRMGRDQRRKEAKQNVENISIHSPRMGRDGSPGHDAAAAKYFNPLSPHGERRIRRVGPRLGINFNPLSPHGERRRTA